MLTPVSHGIPPPPPWISFPQDKIPYGKRSPSMGFLPPPPKKKPHMLSQYYIRNLCWRRFAIEGERLPYGIISGGTICRGICSLSMIFVCVWGGGGEIYHRGGSFTIWYCPSSWGSSAMGFLPGQNFNVWHTNFFP